MPAWARSFLLYLAVSVISRLPFALGGVLNADESTHIVGSWVLLGGGHLYVDFVDNKPPLLYVFYAGAQLLLGDGLLSVRLVTIFILVPLTALGVSALAGHGRRGRIAALLFLVSSVAFDPHDMHAANCELIMLAPAVWAFALAAAAPSARRALAAGALLGVAALVKQQYAAFWILAVLAHARGRRRLVAIGAIAPILLAAARFAVQGTAADLLEWTVLQNVGYARNPVQLGEALHRTVLNLGGFVVSNVALLVAGAWGLLELDERRRRLVGLMAVATVPPILIGFRVYGHYLLPLCAPIAVAAAPVVEALTDSERLGRIGKRAIVAIVLAPAVIWTCVGAMTLFRDDSTPARAFRGLERRVAATLRADPCATSLFVWGPQTTLYYFTHLTPAARFVPLPTSVSGWVFGNDAVGRGEIDTSGLIDPEHVDLLFADLERNRPALIVDTSEADGSPWRRFPLRRPARLAALLDRDYELAGEISGIKIHRRNGCRR